MGTDPARGQVGGDEEEEGRVLGVPEAGGLAKDGRPRARGGKDSGGQQGRLHAATGHV